MPYATFEYRDEAERLAMEQAIAFVSEMRDCAMTAEFGQVLEVCEERALAGRELLQKTLQKAVQARIDQAEEKKGSTRLRVRGPASAEASLQPLGRDCLGRDRP